MWWNIRNEWAINALGLRTYVFIIVILLYSPMGLKVTELWLIFYYRDYHKSQVYWRRDFIVIETSIYHLCSIKTQEKQKKRRLNIRGSYQLDIKLISQWEAISIWGKRKFRRKKRGKWQWNEFKRLISFFGYCLIFIIRLKQDAVQYVPSQMKRRKKNPRVSFIWR